MPPCPCVSERPVSMHDCDNPSLPWPPRTDRLAASLQHVLLTPSTASLPLQLRQARIHQHTRARPTLAFTRPRPRAPPPSTSATTAPGTPSRTRGPTTLPQP